MVKFTVGILNILGDMVPFSTLLQLITCYNSICYMEQHALALFLDILLVLILLDAFCSYQSIPIRPQGEVL